MKIYKSYKNFFFIKIIFFFLVNIPDAIITIHSHKYGTFYVTLTSWKGRIGYIHITLLRLLKNTVKPKKIILNLSSDEFPKKELELPRKLLDIQKKYKNFEIYWVKEDTNVFKKLMPTLKRFKNDLIITMDDDILYPYDIFENMLKCYKKKGANRPMSFGKRTSDWRIGDMIINSHFGPGTIVKYKYFNDTIEDIYNQTTKELIDKKIKCYDDVLYTISSIVNGYNYIRCKDYFINRTRFIPKEKMKGFSENLNPQYRLKSTRYHKIIKDYVKKRYNQTIYQLIKRNMRRYNSSLAF